MDVPKPGCSQGGVREGREGWRGDDCIGIEAERGSGHDGGLSRSSDADIYDANLVRNHPTGPPEIRRVT